MDSAFFRCTVCGILCAAAKISEWQAIHLGLVYSKVEYRADALVHVIYSCTASDTDTCCVVSHIGNKGHCSNHTNTHAFMWQLKPQQPLAITEVVITSANLHRNDVFLAFTEKWVMWYIKWSTVINWDSSISENIRQFQTFTLEQTFTWMFHSINYRSGCAHQVLLIFTYSNNAHIFSSMTMRFINNVCVVWFMACSSLTFTRRNPELQHSITNTEHNPICIYWFPSADDIALSLNCWRSIVVYGFNKDVIYT